MASLGVSLDGRGSGQSDSVGCEPRHCASKDTLSEPNSSSRLQVCIRTATHRATTRFCDPWEGVPCLQIEEGRVGIEAGTQGMVCQDR